MTSPPITPPEDFIDTLRPEDRKLALEVVLAYLCTLRQEHSSDGDILVALAKLESKVLVKAGIPDPKPRIHNVTP